jgi:hypothetical protein
MYQLLHYIGIIAALIVGKEQLPPGGEKDQAAHKLFFANDSASCIIPFSRAGNLIVVKAKADTIEGNFILDTGAPNLVLNIVYFRDYPITQSHDAEQTSITGSAPKTSKTTLHLNHLISARWIITILNLTWPILDISRIPGGSGSSAYWEWKSSGSAS